MRSSVLHRPRLFHPLSTSVNTSPRATRGPALCKHISPSFSPLSGSGSTTIPSCSKIRQKMSTLGTAQTRHKVTVVGSGNWGSAISKIVAENAVAHPDLFEPQVRMWVYEETVTMPRSCRHWDESSPWATQPQPLTALINRFHENVKYLPGVALPENLVAEADLEAAVRGSTVLVFNLPHQFIGGVCERLRGKIVPFARGVSCVKGVLVSQDRVSLFSEDIGAKLGIYCGALSGANIASEVAAEKFSETTIAYDPPVIDSRNPTPHGPSPSSSHVDLARLASSAQQQEGQREGLRANEREQLTSTTTATASSGEHEDPAAANAPPRPKRVQLQPLPQKYPPLDHAVLKALFHRSYFHVHLVSDVAGVSLGGALKNIVALAAGFVEGLGWGDNAKAAVMRVGLLEMVRFGQEFFPGAVDARTFTEESCGVADLITSCSGGRNYRCARRAVERGVSIEEVERDELNGQVLQGTSTAREVNSFLRARGREAGYPLFTAVTRILDGTARPQDIPDLINTP